MGYFMNNILYIVIAAVLIATVTVLWAFIGAKNDSERGERGGCTGDCSSCMEFEPCEKKKIT